LLLRINIRVYNNLSEQDFIDWISSLPYNPSLNRQITFLPFILYIQSVTDLINYIYLQKRLLQALYNYQAFSRQVILSTLNNTIRKLNQTILDILSGQERTYFIVDSADINEADPEIIELLPEVL
jgi:hypothetical protein